MSIRDELVAFAVTCQTALTAGEARPKWTGAHLYDADLGGANLCGADLSGAYIYGAHLYDADLSGANLCGADLSGANLSGADLSGADLSGANLSGANLCGADLSDADLSGANLHGAARCVSAGPVGEEGRIIYGVSHADGPRFKAGCFWGTADELRRAIAEKYADGSGLERFRASYLAAVDFICAALAAQEVPDAP